MKLIFQYNDLVTRQKTELLNEEGALLYYGIYDFSYKYRTRIFDHEGIEISYVEKQITAERDTVCFYAADGTKSGALIRKEGKLVSEDGDLVYEGDLRKGKIEGLMEVSDGCLKIEKEEEVLKCLQILFSLVEIDR